MWRQSAHRDVDGEDDHQWETETEEDGDDENDSEQGRNCQLKLLKKHQPGQFAIQGSAQEVENCTRCDLQGNSLQGYV